MVTIIRNNFKNLKEEVRVRDLGRGWAVVDRDLELLKLEGPSPNHKKI
jgi:hypothetical protein